MKKLYALLFLLVFLVGCSQAADTPVPVSEYESEHGRAPLQIVTSVFPQFDFVRQIAGEKVELSMLISPGGEPHAFEPSPRDIITLNNADLIIYVGGHGESWVETIVNSLDQPNLRRVALLDLVNAVYKEVFEGMEHDHHHHDHSHDHDHDDHHDTDDHNHHDHDHDDHHHHDDEYDEHVWTSPRNVIMIVQALANILAELDPYNAEYYQQNAADYIVQLEELDRAFAEVATGGVRSTVVFGDRFPFRYLMDAYGLTFYAAFPGCSAETQASPATIAFLIDKVNSENIPTIFYTEFSARTIANVIVEATGAHPLELHSAHNVSNADFTGGVTYLDIMNRNLEQLREALN